MNITVYLGSSPGNDPKLNSVKVAMPSSTAAPGPA